MQHNSPELLAQIHGLKKLRIPNDKIAAKLGISSSTVSKYANMPSPVTSNKKKGDFNWREWNGWIADGQKLKKKASRSQDHAEIEIPASEPIILATLSDTHIGSWGADHGALQAITDEILSTKNLYVALLGDYGQYAIKLRSVLEVGDNILPPELQTEYIESWFEELWPKVALATWDNHGVERQEKQSGESSVKRILSKKVVYFNGIGHADLRVGTEVYKLCCSHRFRGTSFLNPVHAIQRYMRMEGWDRELGLMGDTHQPGMLKYADGSLVRVAVNTGALQINSGFAKRYFSLTTHAVFPCVKLYPDKHLMVPFWSIKEALA
jgi:hypothetical protein